MDIEKRLKYILRLVAEEYKVRGVISYISYSTMYNVITLKYSIEQLTTDGLERIEKTADISLRELKSLDALYLVIRESLINK